jgi:hypothetical protein
LGEFRRKNTMTEISISLDDDLYRLLEFYNKAINELGVQKRKIEDFAGILIGLGLMNLSRALGPENDQEMRDFTISILVGTTPKKLALLEIYKKSLEKEQRRLGLIQT